MSHDVAIEILKLATQMQEQSRYRINVFVIAGLHTVDGFIEFGFSENLMEVRLKGRQPVCMRFSKGTVQQLLFNGLCSIVLTCCPEGCGSAAGCWKSYSRDMERTE